MLIGSNRPADVKSVQFAFPLSLKLQNGGTWRVGKAAAQPFPPEQAPKPHMYQGGASSLTLRGEDGKGIRVTIPQFSYQEVNVLREWGTQGFSWMSMATYEGAMTYKIEDAPAAPATPLARVPGMWVPSGRDRRSGPSPFQFRL